MVFIPACDNGAQLCDDCNLAQCVCVEVPTVCTECEQETCVCDVVEMGVIFFLLNWPEQEQQALPFMHYPVGEPIDSPILPLGGIREGYRFDGWFLGNTLFEFDYMPSGQITLAARWTRAHRIDFYLAYNDEYDRPVYGTPIFREHNENLTVAQLNNLDSPLRRGYIFRGWLREGVPFSSQGVISNIRLTATWERGVVLTFNTGDHGSRIDCITVLPGETIAQLAARGVSLPQIPVRSGFGFRRWERGVGVTPNRIYQIFDFAVMPDPANYVCVPDNEIVIRAAWTEQPLDTLPVVFIDIRSNNASNLGQLPGTTIPLGSVQNPRWNFGNSSWIRSYIRIENAQDSSHNLEQTPFDFRGRGSGSWNDHKRGYRIRFDNHNHQSLLGMPTNRNFVLVAGANFTDRTMLANHSAYSLARAVFDGIDYSARSRMVQIFFNGTFHGVYMLAEHARPVPYRVPIVSTFDAAVDAGETPTVSRYSAFYLEHCIRANGHEMGNEPLPMNYEWFFANGGNGIGPGASRSATACSLARNLVPSADRLVPNFGGVRHPFDLIAPNPSNRSANSAVFDQQRLYAIEHTSDLMRIIFNRNTTRAQFELVANLDSFVDMYLLHELFKNLDTGWSSFFIYRTYGRDGRSGVADQGGRFYLGPPWDFDATIGRGRQDGGLSNWATPQGLFVACSTRANNLHNTFNEMLYVLTRHNWFAEVARARWTQISGDVNNFIVAHYNHYLNNHATAFGRDLLNWSTPTDGRPQRPGATYGSLTAATNAWTTYTTNARNWLTSRIAWLNQNVSSLWGA